MMELGGNIKLSGFSDDDKSSLIVIKKLVGNFVKHFSHTKAKVDSLDLTRKDVHTNQHELHAKLVSEGKVLNVEHTGRNLYVVLDKVFKKLEESKK
jgi:ribosome-associated translation inhibitor RaiA